MGEVKGIQTKASFLSQLARTWRKTDAFCLAVKQVNIGTQSNQILQTPVGYSCFLFGPTSCVIEVEPVTLRQLRRERIKV